VAEPRSLSEFLERFHRHQRVSGYGLDTTQHFPCPFCAAADWAAVQVVDADFLQNRAPAPVQRVLGVEGGIACRECGRSARTIFTSDGAGTRMEVVQTGGPDQPEWLVPKMRRV
jgi:hypothetical protein